MDEIAPTSCPTQSNTLATQLYAEISIPSKVDSGLSGLCKPVSLGVPEVNEHMLGITAVAA